MNIRIAICDDEADYRRQIVTVLDHWFYRKKDTYTCTHYLSGEDLLQDEDRIYRYDIIFLDVIMHNLTGIETARHIRQKHCHAYLVFITSYADYAIQGYEVEAVRYILKDQLKPALEDCMETILKKINAQAQYLEVFVKQCKMRIPLHQIQYIENLGHNQTIFLTDDMLPLQTRDSMDRFEEELHTHGFLRIHKSYLVNFAYVCDVNNYILYLKDGTELPVPRTKYRLVKNYFIQQLGVK